MFDEESLFGEETTAQIYEMLKDIEDLKDGFGACQFPQEEKRLTNAIFQIRESVLIAAVNQINAFLEESEFSLSSQTWTELKALYLYGKGYHNRTADEDRKRRNAYKLFRYQLAKQGKLIENLDLCRDANF